MGNNKDANLLVRLERAELAAWRGAAEGEGATLSEWVRAACDAAARRSRYEADIVAEVIAAEAEEELEDDQ